LVAGAIGFLLGRGTAPAPSEVQHAAEPVVHQLAAPVDAGAAADASSERLSPEVVSTAPAPSAARPRPSSPSSQPSSPRPAGADIAAERTLLDRARSALARGDASGALTAAGEHEQRFPEGVLVEEREAVAIRALILGGRRAEATQRAATFRRRFSRSLFLPTLDAELDAGP
jgi:hypothetical protein